VCPPSDQTSQEIERIALGSPPMRLSPAYSPTSSRSLSTSSLGPSDPVIVSLTRGAARALANALLDWLPDSSSSRVTLVISQGSILVQAEL